MDLTYISVVAQLVAAIMATIHFHKYKQSNERYFLHFLWLTVFVEVTAGVLADVYTIDTYWLFNSYMFISFLFFFYWYYSILQAIWLKRVVLVCVFLFLAIVVWDYLYRDELGYQEYTFVSGAFLTMVCTVMHFRQLLFSDEVLILKHKLSFWISTGLFLFNIGMIPFMLLSDYFSFSGNIYYLIIIVSLNVLLYGCYIIGFQWTKERYNRF